MKGSLEDGLRALIGAPVSAVVFVQDYLPLIFQPIGRPRPSRRPYQYPGVNLYVWPVVNTAGVSLCFGASGYRDAVCSLINSQVLDASVASDLATLHSRVGSH